MMVQLERSVRVAKDAAVRERRVRVLHKAIIVVKAPQ